MKKSCADVGFICGYESGQYRKTVDELDFAVNLQHVELRKENSVASSTDSQTYAIQQLGKTAPRIRAICAVMTLLVASVCGAYVMWFTPLYRQMIDRHLVLRNNTLRFDMWRRQPVQTYLKVYIFNYTNIKEFEQEQDEKFKLEELGPFTYSESVERVNAKFNDDKTVSYQEKRVYRFAPHLSSNGEFDSVVVPSLPFMGAIALTEHSYFLIKLSLSALLKSMSAEPFIRVPAHDFLWGYEDSLSDTVSQLLRLQHPVNFTKFGILASKNGTQRDVYTIHTGQDDVSKLGLVTKLNGDSHLAHWGTDDCNRIDGTDGSMFPPPAIRPNGTVYLYSKDICRRMPLSYHRQYRNTDNINVLRFHVTETAFASGDEHSANQCYCRDGGCSTTGVFDVSPCAFGGPVLTSLPHFLYGNETLFEKFEGLEPDVAKHESYAEIEPTFGVPVTGVSRLQLNIMVRRSPGIAMPAAYGNGLILPVAWMEFGSEQLPGDMSAFIKTLLFFVHGGQFLLSYGSVTAAAVCIMLLVRQILQRDHVRKHQRVLATMSGTSSIVPLVRKS